MQRVCKVLLVSSWFAVMSLVVAQTPTALVVGTVLNEATGLPISGLSVYLIDSEGQRLPPDEATEQDATEQDVTEQDVTEQNATDLNATDLNVTDLEGRFAIANVTPDAWYGIEIYLSDILRFTDFIFIDGSSISLNSEGLETVELTAPINLTLKRN